MFSNDDLQQKVADVLKRAGVDLVNVATSPVALDRATAVVTGLLPFGFRHLGRERVRGIILQIAERVPKTTGPQIQTPLANANKSDIDDRVELLQDQVRQAFGDSYGTKKNLRGYDADIDILCGRLIKDCEALEAEAPANKAVLIRLLVTKALVLGNWQKLQGSKTNQRNAVDCYEGAAALAEGQPELQAEIRYRYGKFCAAVDEEISGGKEKTIEQFRIATALGAPNSASRLGSEQELERLQKKRWPF
jgi:hypothetical protein